MGYYLQCLTHYIVHHNLFVLSYGPSTSGNLRHKYGTCLVLRRYNSHFSLSYIFYILYISVFITYFGTLLLSI